MNKDGFKAGQELSFGDILALRGRGSKEPEEGAAPQDFTREAIDEMSKDDVRDLLKLHKVEHDGRASEDELRELLKKTMFVDL